MVEIQKLKKKKKNMECLGFLASGWIFKAEFELEYKI